MLKQHRMSTLCMQYMRTNGLLTATLTWPLLWRHIHLSSPCLSLSRLRHHSTHSDIHPSTGPCSFSRGPSSSPSAAASVPNFCQPSRWVFPGNIWGLKHGNKRMVMREINSQNIRDRLALLFTKLAMLQIAMTTSVFFPFWKRSYWESDSGVIQMRHYNLSFHFLHVQGVRAPLPSKEQQQQKQEDQNEQNLWDFACTSFSGFVSQHALGW